jgi:predicted anti-sigma-YlaC factor YlaD
MKAHLSEEQISAWLDHQLEDDAAGSVEQHVAGCDQCRAVRDGLSAVDQLFRKAEVVEPPPYMWSKISAGLEEAGLENAGWFSRLASTFTGNAWVRAEVLALAATMVLGCSVAVLHWSTLRTERRQLAEIDFTYQKLLPQNAESYNPFATSPQIDTGRNPFRLSDADAGSKSSPSLGKR